MELQIRGLTYDLLLLERKLEEKRKEEFRSDWVRIYKMKYISMVAGQDREDMVWYRRSEQRRGGQGGGVVRRHDLLVRSTAVH